MKRKAKKKLVEQLINSMIYTPHDWKSTEFNYLNDDVSFWIANGRSFMALKYPVEIKFNFFQRRKLWNAYQTSIIKKLLK